LEKPIGEERPYPRWGDGYMINRLGSYLALRPRKAAVLVLTLIVVLVLVLAGWTLQLSHFGRAPYPSEKVPLSLVHDKVTYTQETTTVMDNETPSESFPYTGMKIAFRVDWGMGGWQTATDHFGNQSQLSNNSTTTVHQVEFQGRVNVSIDITDSTGDGSFDRGDTIVFEIVPLLEDTVHTMGLLWSNGHQMTMEVSFAIHDGKLYAWNSQYLNTEKPWFDW
jgi:hypothetical protein